jgi:hypothetical protein
MYGYKHAVTEREQYLGGRHPLSLENMAYAIYSFTSIREFHETVRWVDESREDVVTLLLIRGRLDKEGRCYLPLELWLMIIKIVARGACAAESVLRRNFFCELTSAAMRKYHQGRGDINVWYEVSGTRVPPTLDVRFPLPFVSSKFEWCARRVADKAETMDLLRVLWPRSPRVLLEEEARGIVGRIKFLMSGDTTRGETSVLLQDLYMKTKCVDIFTYLWIRGHCCSRFPHITKMLRGLPFQSARVLGHSMMMKLATPRLLTLYSDDTDVKTAKTTEEYISALEKVVGSTWSMW